jgi:hypothetical protein
MVDELEQYLLTDVQRLHHFTNLNQTITTIAVKSLLMIE